ncbi:MAG: PIG-L family deacetylase, partial [Myxococcaceae bacterium]|nr:PIG-L family deacetylase [Myxococcaceae bacterium]
MVALLLLAVGGAFAWAKSLFREPSAQRVDSVIGALGARRVLGFFAHPDDEQLLNGFYLHAARDGAHTALVTMTRGEAGHQTPVVARQKDLGVVRHAEALKNGYALQIDDQEVWDYPDGGVPGVPEEELVTRIADVIRRERPDVVLTFWPRSGATGHADHMQVGKLTAQAVRQVRGEAQPGQYAGPRWIVYPTTPTKALTLFGGKTGRFVADNQPKPTYVMPGEVDSKRAGWTIHA